MEANRLLQELYSIARRLESAQLFNHAFPFNNTEMQLIKEILRAKETGGRMISSRLAKVLGITRPDDKDRKIAYIELSDTARAQYEDMKERVNAILSSVIGELGDEKVETFVKSAHEFVDAFDGAVARQTAGRA